jgi:hypothetical protein
MKAVFSSDSEVYFAIIVLLGDASGVFARRTARAGYRPSRPYSSRTVAGRRVGSAGVSTVSSLAPAS